MKWEPPPLSIIEVIKSSAFLNDIDISVAQITALKSVYGLPLNTEELAIYLKASEKTSYKPGERRECTFICGRRSGKDSKLCASIAIYEALFRTHRLALGERGTVLLLASTSSQARICFDYIAAKLQASPLLAGLITDIRQEEIDLVNNITICVMPANFRTIRGRSVVCGICSEIAWWHDSDSGRNPASEILKALRPAMATFPTSKLILASSPYAKQGALWKIFNRRHAFDFGNKRLVWRLDSLTMNPSLDVERLREEESNDVENYRREWLSEFFESASTFLSAASIDSCVLGQRFEWAPQPDFHYVGALDAAFRSDNFGFSICHIATSGDVVQDLTRSWLGSKATPVQLAEVLAQIVEDARRYGITKIFGDQFCSEPIRQNLASQGIEFCQRQTLGARASCMNSLKTLINSRKIALLDDAATLHELKSLEMIITSSGNVRIEARQTHDDRAVSLALAAHECIAAPRLHPPMIEFIDFRDRPASDFAPRTEQDLRSPEREEHCFGRRESSFSW